MSLRSDPARRVLENYPLRFSQRLLFSDVDTNRHMNNVAMARFFEEGRSENNRHMFAQGAAAGAPPDRQLMVVSLFFEFLGQGRYPGTVEIGSAITRVGGSSFVHAHAAFQDGACIALGEAVMVKTRSGRPVALSDEERRAAAELVLRGLAVSD